MTETYSVAADFGGITPSAGQLEQDVLADAGITTTLNSVIISGDAVDFNFAATIGAGEKIALDLIVSNYVLEVFPSIVLGVSTGADNTTMTLTSAQTTNRTVTIPDIDDTLTGLTATQTLTNKTLTSPRIGASVLDANGNELFALTATTSAVNDITIANAATGNNPQISMTGDDANVGLDIVSKGTGVFNFNAGDASTSAEIRLGDNTGSEYIGITTPATVTSRTHTLPDTADDTFAMLAAAQTLTNKTMDASSNTFSNFLHGTQVDNPSSGVHGVTGTIVGTTDAQTLTNKTIDSTTNTVTSDKIRYSSGTINVSASSAPLFDQQIKAIDSATGAWDWDERRRHVEAATVTAGTLATDFENGDIIDGYTLQTGDRILIKDQASGVENGIYVVNATGAPSRAGDMPVGISSDSIVVYCHLGDVNGGANFTVTNVDGSDIVGTDAINFVSTIDLAPMARIANSTFFNVQHLQDIFHSSGYSSGGIITDAGGNTINVSAGTGFIRGVNDILETIFFFDWPALNGTTVPADTVRYIGIEFNSGSPQVSVRTSDIWNYNTDFPLGTATYQSGNLHILNNPHAVGDHAGFMIRRLATTQAFIKNNLIGGLILGETGTRNITLSAGAIWSKLREFSISAVDTSVADTMESYYRDGVGGFTRTAGITQWPNTQYDDGSGTLATMTAGYYAVIWFYVEISGNHITFLYGTNEYALEADAEAEGPPGTIPLVIQFQSVLVAKIIFQNGASTASQIIDLFTIEALNLTTAGAHNNLSGLQGGAAGEFYHLDLTDYGYITGLGSNAVGVSDTQTLTNKTLTSPRIGTSVLDTNGNELLGLTATGSAVNEFTLTNATTGTDPVLSATGDDANIGIALETKGAGTVSIGSASATDSGIIEILDDTGGESASITVPSALGASYTITLPTDTGVNGQFLRTNGGNPATLDWASPAGSGDVTGPVSSTDNAVVRFNGTSGTAIQNSGVILSDTDSLSGILNVGMSGDILDANGNELVNFITTASAVNEIAITNSATGTSPLISVTGGDANINMRFSTKGTGTYEFLGTTASQASLRLYEDTDSGSNYIDISIPAAITANRTHTLPDLPSDTIALIAGTQTLTNKTLVSPIINTAVLDTNSNEIINLTATASAVNEITVANAATGANPIISATGGDANVGLEYLTKGTGTHIFDNDTSAAELRLRDDTGTDYFGIRPAAATTSYTVTMPPAQGGANQVLTNNGAGTLSWSNGTLSSQIATSTVSTSTTSGTYVVMNAMTITPGAGTYLVMFSSSGNGSNNNTTLSYAIFNNGTIISHTERIMSIAAQQVTGRNTAIYTQTTTTVAAGQAIDVRYRTTGGTFSVHERNLILVQLS